MKCPFCGASDTKVVDTRTMEDNSVIRRRRFCPECSERFTTYERVDTIPLTVVKSDETRESFDRGKILKGMLMSCNKRPVSVEEFKKEGALWSWFMVWHTDHIMDNDKKNLKEVYNHEDVITLDELPNFLEQ